ncbi:transglycosylase SLT domain-containing protein [Phytohalomonas tamaricis]|uniref:transglycosylase SLT domain-containing protein n=1 Tax=Phytohalomonas tamaricis TaxID=2081032 RepID=UPI0021D41086|nr:transglycosylase SLT domain-containing protein [Phytohalomonas tamaricis]
MTRRLKFSNTLLAGLVTFGLVAAFPVLADDGALRQALDAARQKDWNRIDHASINDSVLVGYVEYHELKDRLPQVAPAEIVSFIKRYADSPLAEWMRSVAQVRYGQAHRFDAYLAVSDGEPSGAIRQCYYYTALLDQNPERAALGGRQLWLVGKSQPDACDPLFDRLRTLGKIDDADVWRRMMMAWENDETGLADYLAKQLSADWANAVDAYELLKNDYSHITAISRTLGPGGEASPQLYGAAMYNYTRANTEAALAAWQRLSANASISDEQRHTIEHDLAFYSLVRHVDANSAWVDQVLPRLNDDDLFELRVRNALASRDWRGVFDWVRRMPNSIRTEAHWQYWLGRALEQLGDDTTARKAYAAAANERSFFGFAAADKLKVPYALNQEVISVNDAQREHVAALPVISRIKALYRINEPGLARSEWYALVGRSSAEDIPALAAYALSQQWYDLTVYASIKSKRWDALSWRFPHAYEPLFVKWGQARGVDPYFLMGIARRESAFNTQAVSPVGARGLMQLMPATARHVSQKESIPYDGEGSLDNAEINIRLGSAYIKSMLDRYQGNRIAAAAAYNAGPGRVDRWLAQNDQPFDLFVESIPYRETREYVQAVLSYRAIFDSLSRGETQAVAMLNDSERDRAYNSSLKN